MSKKKSNIDPNEFKILSQEKDRIRQELSKLFVLTNHPNDLVVMELIREAAQRAKEFNISLDDCLEQFRDEYDLASGGHA